MVYAVLRLIAGVALRWHYRDIQIEGVERVPRTRPLLLLPNHPNALVDALLVGWVVPRRVLITAKATLFANPVAGALLRSLGVVPLRRASDEAKRAEGKPLDPARNIETFRAVHDALARGGAVLIFPEGKTPDEPTLAPLKTGAARMALYARDSGSVPGLAIVPIGLVFERKEQPRSRVLVDIGEPILVDDWHAPQDGTASEALTREIETRIRARTLNYATNDEAARAVQLATAIASVFDSSPAVSDDRRFGVETSIARRIDQISATLPGASEEMRAAANALVARIDAVRAHASQNGVRLEDVSIDVDLPAGARFTVREALYLLLGGPLALWGRINHWLPFRVARLIALRNVESSADPAMRTIIVGTALVLLVYVAQTVIVSAIWGPVIGAVYLVSLPLAADVNLRFSERLFRATKRARTYLRFRRDPSLRDRLRAELASLRRDVLAFNELLDTPPRP